MLNKCELSCTIKFQGKSHLWPDQRKQSKEEKQIRFIVIKVDIKGKKSNKDVFFLMLVHYKQLLRGAFSYLVWSSDDKICLLFAKMFKIVFCSSKLKENTFRSLLQLSTVNKTTMQRCDNLSITANLCLARHFSYSIKNLFASLTMLCKGNWDNTIT